jgi:mRNA interferase RelE/StbE
MYEVLILNSAAKQLRNFDRHVKIKIVAALDQIAANPFVGEQLKGDLKTVYSYHLQVAGIEYRIAYQIKEWEIVVMVMQIGTRENFYAKLKKRFD